MIRFLRRTALGTLAATFIGAAAMADDVVIGIQSEPSSLDPHFHNTSPNNNMLGQIFGRLVDWSADKTTIIPRLATSWKAIDDTTWEFKLRQGEVPRRFRFHGR